MAIYKNLFIIYKLLVSIYIYIFIKYMEYFKMSGSCPDMSGKVLAGLV